jgi:NADPH2:quinone reductase
MRAIVFDQYGGPEVLRLAEMPEPVAGAEQVLIRIAAAAVNPADYKWRDGMFKDFVPIAFPHILGYDVAGTVIAVGSNVSSFSVGDRVAAMLNPMTKGGYAEKVAVDAASVANIPAGLDFPTAAAIPCAGLTGTQMIEEFINVKAGETVLITGATGSVGRFALAAALRRGARVIAAVRARQAAEARARGAADVVVLGEEDWQGAAFDHVCDTVGGDAVAALCRHVKPGGLIRTAATTPINPQGLPSEPQFVAVHPDGPGLQSLAAEVAAGRLPVKIAHRLPLARAAEAQRMVEAGGLEGKVVLEP